MPLNGDSIFPITTNSRLVESKIRILKQQVKLLTANTTLARWNKVLSQTLIHLNDQLVSKACCIVCQIENPCQVIQHLKGLEVTEDRKWPDSHRG